MPVQGLGFEGPVRSFRNFFGTYGTTGGSIRGLANFILPVAVVDRYRDDNEGSLFGLTMTAQKTSPASHIAFAVGSPADDWELVGANFGVLVFGGGLPARGEFNLMMYTPDATFLPVVTPSPVGIFQAGMNTDFAFTRGSVTGVAGFNPTLPTPFGDFPFQTFTQNFLTVFSSTVFSFNTRAVFDPPIRIYRDVTLGFTVIENHAFDYDMTLALRYRLRPRTTDGPRTGL